MRRNQKGLIHLTVIFVLAVLLLITAWVANQGTQSQGLASELPQDYFGILRENNFFDCGSGFHLVNLEEDEVAHCLTLSGESAAGVDLSEFVNQSVRVYGTIFEVGGKKHLLVQTIEKSRGVSTLKSKMLDVLGSFIKRVIAH